MHADAAVELPAAEELATDAPRAVVESTVLTEATEPAVIGAPDSVENVTEPTEPKSLKVDDSGVLIATDVIPAVEEAELVAEEEAYALPDESGPELEPYELAYEAEDVSIPVDEAESDAVETGMWTLLSFVFLTPGSYLPCPA